MMTDFSVSVKRDMGVDYESKVYAIDVKRNRFLVYDPGDEFTGGGFTWVDFTERTSTQEDEDGFPYNLPVVDLCEDED